MYGPLDDSCLAAIEALFGLTLQPATFRLKDAPVFEFTLADAPENPGLRVVLWPSLRRVDVYAGRSSWIIKSIDEVEVLPGVEAIFHRHDPPAFLFVTTAGRASLVT
jgi:hypothetical protein